MGIFFRKIEDVPGDDDSELREKFVKIRAAYIAQRSCIEELEQTITSLRETNANRVDDLKSERSIISVRDRALFDRDENLAIAESTIRIRDREIQELALLVESAQGRYEKEIAMQERVIRIAQLGMSQDEP